MQRTLDAVPTDIRPRSVALAAAGGVLATSTVVGSEVVDDGPATAEASESTSTLRNIASDSEAWQRLDDAKITATRGSTASTDVTRSSGRPSLDALKEQSLEKREVQSKGSHKASAKIEVEAADPRDIARSMLSEYGWGQDQFPCLDELWIGESKWDFEATNPTSGAYGIPQALPAEKMATAGDDWETNPATQIEWGLGYIEDRYGTPCAANEFKLGNNWY